MTQRFFSILLVVMALVIPQYAFSSSDAGPGVSPQQALDMLKVGNERFVSDKAETPHCDLTRRTETASQGQHPYATILSCSDSRVPAEILFDQGIGDLFVIRVAGNVADTDELGTAEYGIDHLGTPLFVVLGHTKCGAVTAVAQNAEVHGHIPQLVDNIIPAVKAVKAAKPAIAGDMLVSASIQANVWQAIEDTLTKSKIIADRVKGGKAQIVGALYDLESGKVEWLGPHPRQQELLAAVIQTPEHAAPQTAATQSVQIAESSRTLTIVIAALGFIAIVAMLIFLDKLL